MDSYINNIKKGYILKHSAAFLSICLLFAPSVYADPLANAVETSVAENVVNPTVENSTAAESAVVVTAPSATTSATTNSNLTPAVNPQLELSKYADYSLSPGDSLEISVWKEEGMQQQQFLIAPDGTIIHPLIGSVLAAGKTITELKEILTSKLSDYISAPSVTVKLLGNQGNTIFVIGKVQKPGQFYTGRRIDVLQALSLAGGVTVFANESSISILRRVGNEIKVFPFDYSDVIKGDDLEQNILLEPGDTVTVP